MLWCLNNKGKLTLWGIRKKTEILEEQEIRKAEKNAQKAKNDAEQAKKDAKRAKRDAKKQTRVIPVAYDDSDEFEVQNLSVKELNESCEYPEWYDGCSD